MGSLAEVVEDCLGVLQVYSDGSIYRANESEIEFGMNHTQSDDNNNNNASDNDDVEWEDCMYDEEHKLYVRVYKPIARTKNNDSKLAILYYIHGGGFCVGSRTWPNCHNCCLRLSSQLHALVIAPDYRLAPEHRLPAAIEDGIKAVKWLQQHVQGITKGQSSSSGSLGRRQNTYCRLLDDDDDKVEFEQVFILGDSSGGNVAHHLAVHFGSGSPGLDPVRIRGYVLLAPFFGAILRTHSEAHAPPEPILNLDILDRFWRLSLPSGETRDHPIANPFGPFSPKLEKVSLDPMLIIVGGREIMKDRVEDYAKRLREQGKDITFVELEGQHHGFLTNNPHSDVSNQVFQLLKQFMFTKITS